MKPPVIDTSVMIAVLVATHEFHDVARPHLRSQSRVPAIVLAETYAQLRRTFAQTAEVAAGLLRTWTDDETRILRAEASAVRAVFVRAAELNLGGDVHDALIAQTCIWHATTLVSLDRRQHRVALALGARSTYLIS